MTDDQSKKLYAIFAGDTFYASGGWDDYQDIVFESLSDAKEFAELICKEVTANSKDYTPKDWAHVVDLTGLYIVHRVGRAAYMSPKYDPN